MAGVLAFLFGLAKAVGVVDVEQQVRSAIQGDRFTEDTDDDVSDGEPQISPTDEETMSGREEPAELRDSDREESDELEDIRVGHDVDALHPVLTGPAVQILPLGLCV
jgi:hypothetical protein